MNHFLRLIVIVKLDDQEYRSQGPVDHDLAGQFSPTAAVLLRGQALCSYVEGLELVHAAVVPEPLWTAPEIVDK